LGCVVRGRGYLLWLGLVCEDLAEGEELGERSATIVWRALVGGVCAERVQTFY